MLERGEGYVLVTASAAGLLNIVEAAPYGVTKHAAAGLAEWLCIACVDGVLTAEQVAQAVVDTMRAETFAFPTARWRRT